MGGCAGGAGFVSAAGGAGFTRTGGPGLIGATFGSGGGGGCANSKMLREPPSMGAVRSFASRSSFSVGSMRLMSVPSGNLSDGRKSSVELVPREAARCIGIGPLACEYACGAARNPAGFNAAADVVVVEIAVREEAAADSGGGRIPISIR